MKLLSRTMLGLVVGTAAIGFVSVFAKQQGDGTAPRQAVVVIGDGGYPMGRTPIGPGSPKEIVVPWEKPTGSAPSWLDSNEDSKRTEDHVRKVLEQRMEVEFNALPLLTVAKIIRHKFEIPVVIDEKALEDENITLDQPVTLERPPTKLCDLLTLILRPLQLTYVIEFEGITITSMKTSANKIKYYDLSYILPDNGILSELLISIETMVFPDQWQLAGGNSSITTVGSMLLVSAPEDTHREMTGLLRAISKQSTTNMKPRVFERMDGAKPVPTSAQLAPH